MKNTKKSPADNDTKAHEAIRLLAARHGITPAEATALLATYLEREERYGFVPGWSLKLIDAQFQTHIGPYRRIRCGDEEKEMAHMIPDPGIPCHDCGCVRGEYHVFGCDSEECSNCGGQAFCCDCPAEQAEHKQE